MTERDYSGVSAICTAVYPTELPYTSQELAAHHRVFPEGQFVVRHDATGSVAGAHFTLLLVLRLFHLDDSWDTLTAGGSFEDHDPCGHTLYGADLFVHPGHQHHGIARALTVAARELVRARSLWRMVGGSRMPGYGRVAAQIAPDDYIERVKCGELVDPVLTAHLHDGWDAVTAIRGYLPHDVESAGWAAIIQWLNPACPPPPEFDANASARVGLSRPIRVALSRRRRGSPIGRPAVAEGGRGGVIGVLRPGPGKKEIRAPVRAHTEGAEIGCTGDGPTALCAGAIGSVRETHQESSDG